MEKLGAGIVIIVTLFWFSSEGDKTSGFSRRVSQEASSKQRAAAVTSNNINTATKTMTTAKFIKKAEEIPGIKLQTASTAVTRLHLTKKPRTAAQPGSRLRKWGQIEKPKVCKAL